MEDPEAKSAPLEGDAKLSEDDEKRVEGVQLTHKALAHEVNNGTTGATGVLDMLLEQRLLPANLIQSAVEALEGLNRARTAIYDLGRVKRIVTKDSPIGPILDIKASSSVANTPKPPTIPTSPKP